MLAFGEKRCAYSEESSHLGGNVHFRLNTYIYSFNFVVLIYERFIIIRVRINLTIKIFKIFKLYFDRTPQNNRKRLGILIFLHAP